MQDVAAPKISHMAPEFQTQQNDIVNKRFADIAHAVIENRYTAPSHVSSGPQRVAQQRGHAVKAKELPDAGFTYAKNYNFESVTKPDKPLALPADCKYNIVIGSLQQAPHFAKQRK